MLRRYSIHTTNYEDTSKQIAVSKYTITYHRYATL
jgi:hypothetical protein